MSATSKESLEKGEALGSSTEANIWNKIKFSLSQEGMTKLWERTKAYYKENGESGRLDNYTGIKSFKLTGSDPYANYGITLQNFTYGELDVAKTPVVARTETFQNDGDEPAQAEFEFSKTVTDTFSFGFTEGLTVGAKATLKTGLPVIAEGEVELSAEVKFEANQEWTHTESKEFRMKAIVVIPPHQTVKVTGFITNANINTDFSGVATAKKGFMQVSFIRKDIEDVDELPVPLRVLLPDEAMRSVPLSGTFKGAEGINIYTHVEKVNG